MKGSGVDLMKRTVSTHICINQVNV